MKSSVVNLFWDKFLIQADTTPTVIEGQCTFTDAVTIPTVVDRQEEESADTKQDDKKALILELESLMERLDEMLESVMDLKEKIPIKY